jgi:hypothetical protein
VTCWPSRRMSPSRTPGTPAAAACCSAPSTTGMAGRRWDASATSSSRRSGCIPSDRGWWPWRRPGHRDGSAVHVSFDSGDTWPFTRRYGFRVEGHRVAGRRPGAGAAAGDRAECRQHGGHGRRPVPARRGTRGRPGAGAGRSVRPGSRLLGGDDHPGGPGRGDRGVRGPGPAGGHATTLRDVPLERRRPHGHLPAHRAGHGGRAGARRPARRTPDVAVGRHGRPGR